MAIHYKIINTKSLLLTYVVILACMGHAFLFVSGEAIKCIAREREALLRFKHGLRDDHSVLSKTWGSEDHKTECCNWKGVGCSNTTGHVIALLLDGLYLGGKINSALLELHHLTNLDMSFNDFGWNQIPEFIGSMKSLQHLNLAFSNFYGNIPPQLGNLTNLRTLQISSNDVSSKDLHWLSHLSSLTVLDLSAAKISDPNWLEHVLKLHSLQELHLGGCTITYVKLPPSHSVTNSSFTSLSVLDLSESGLNSSTFLAFLLNTSTSFVEMYLSYNQLKGPIPDAFGELIFLEYLDLSNNKLDGEIPKSLGRLSFLDVLDLSKNKLEGGIPESLGNLISLVYIDISTNMLRGGIPKSLGKLTHLQTMHLSRNNLGESLEGLFGNQSCKVMVSLDLSYNQLTGSVPDLCVCVKLKELYLDNNKLTGAMPVCLGQLSKLEVLDLSSNSLQGIITETHFMKLHNLKRLSLSFNALIFNMSPDWTPPFHLDYINLANCKMGPSFPSWFKTQTGFYELDISSAGISDEVPKWFWNLSYYVPYLNLSHNQISGIIPNFSSRFIVVLDVSSNNFSGPLPLLHSNTSVVQMSQNKFTGSISSLWTNSYYELMLIDLSNNQLEGVLPKYWQNTSQLRILNLNENHFSGEIPPYLCSSTNLKTLHLRNNNLSGELPSGLMYCQDLQLLDIGGNKISGNIPPWLSGANYPNMAYLSLGDNRFSGSIPPEICSLTQIQMLDLSVNSISGKIPRCFNNFTSMADKNKTVSTTIVFPASANYYIDYALVQWKRQELEYRNTLGLLKLIDLSSNKLVGGIPQAFSSLKGMVSLNLSRNNLTGNIDPNIGKMEMLECLDLSRNQLSGEIPTGLAKLHYLAVLDLANNNLSGKIPTSTQLQSFEKSAYAGNRELCGLPLAPCPGGDANGEEDINENNDGFMGLYFMQDLGISMAFGFIVGFWGVIGTLLLKKSWRSAYFEILDAIGDWLYVSITVFFNKFRRN